MSYSRWSNSRWYTFWSSTSSSETKFKMPTKRLKRKQTFEICDIPGYYITYGDIEDMGIDEILKNVEEFYSKSHTDPPTPEELKELSEYILEFKNDVNKHFKLAKFIKFEWWYPFRNKIRNEGINSILGLYK